MSISPIHSGDSYRDLLIRGIENQQSQDAQFHKKEEEARKERASS